MSPEHRRPGRARRTDVPRILNSVPSVADDLRLRAQRAGR